MSILKPKILLYFALLAIAVAAIFLASPPALATGGPVLAADPIASGFDDITDIQSAGDGRLFIATKGGDIYVVQANGDVNSTPFLSVPNITASSSSFGEQGLLGLTFDPDYATNGYFYVHYTFGVNTFVNPADSRVSRFTVSTGNPDVANANSEFKLIEVTQDFSNHNGGQIAFGPNDGYLYISLGDGGSGGDPNNRGQNKNFLLGKLLRIDVDGSGGSECGGVGNYGVPADNPFVDAAGCDEIWAYGLRNAWRFDFDDMTGDIWIADVGQNAWEEIDFEPADSDGGVNYGWRCREGSNNFNTNGCGGLTLEDPIFEYAHSSGRCSVTGGKIYRGSAYPAMDGFYFFSDVCTDDFWVTEQTSRAFDTTGPFELPIVGGGKVSGARTFGEDNNGEVYVANFGTVYQIIDTNAPVTAVTLDGVETSSAESVLVVALFTLALLSLTGYFVAKPKQ